MALRRSTPFGANFGLLYTRRRLVAAFFVVRRDGPLRGDRGGSGEGGRRDLPLSGDADVLTVTT